MLVHFAPSQDLSFYCWDTSCCPKTTCSSVGTFRTVSRPFRLSVATIRAVPRLPAQVLGHFTLSQGLAFLMLGYFTLSQDLLLKCWYTSHRPKTFRSSVGTLRAVPRLPAQVLGHFAPSQDLFVLVLGLFVLSQNYLLKCWDTSHCSKTSCSSVGTFRTIARPFRPSVGTLRAVPRLPAQVLGHFALSQHPHSRVGTLRTVP